jgi:hypothetical protein
LIMIYFQPMSLSRQQRAGIMTGCMAYAWVAAAICLLPPGAWAQQQKPAAPSGDLDVTMQIIVDPDAKLPDEVVRKIPLPTRKAPEQPATGPASTKQTPAADAAAKGQERAQETRELGREASERAKERGKEAVEQREQAGRSTAEQRRRDPPGPPTNPPGRPERPPGR